MQDQVRAGVHQRHLPYPSDQRFVQRFGSRSFKEVLQPAIDIASEGFGVSERIANDWSGGVEALAGDPDSVIQVYMLRIRKAAVDERTSQGGEVVYFVSSADGKLKIGTSANIEKRFDALQTSASVKLTLLLTIPGGTDLETELHRRFVHLRESGEWFQHTDELRHFIEGAAFYKGLGAGTAGAGVGNSAASIDG